MMVSEPKSCCHLRAYNSGLNPCFSGWWSRSLKKMIHQDKSTVLILVLVDDGLGVIIIVQSIYQTQSLNPCFSGWWSRRQWWNQLLRCSSFVLILVLVDDGLGDERETIRATIEVLILVLVDDGLGVHCVTAYPVSSECLNPCFSGWWSRRMWRRLARWTQEYVLILVLVDDGLGVLH